MYMYGNTFSNYPNMLKALDQFATNPPYLRSVLVFDMKCRPFQFMCMMITRKTSLWDVKPKVLHEVNTHFERYTMEV